MPRLCNGEMNEFRRQVTELVMAGEGDLPGLRIQSRGRRGDVRVCFCIPQFRNPRRAFLKKPKGSRDQVALGLTRRGQMDITGQPDKVLAYLGKCVEVSSLRVA